MVDKYWCDRCKKELKESGPRYVLSFDIYDPSVKNGFDIDDKADLCGKCKKELSELVDKAIADRKGEAVAK